VAIPVVLILLFGYALNMDLKDVPTVIWDQSRTPQSRELVGLFDGSPYFSIVDYCNNSGEIEYSLQSTKAMIALVIPYNFSDKILGNDPVSVQVIVDGSDANIGRLALGYTTALGFIYNRNIQAERVESMGAIAGSGISPPVEMHPRAWYNENLRSQNAIMPGIIAIVMVVIAAMLTSVTVAKEWELGTMEQLISTPMRGPELVFGKIAPYFVIGMVDVAISVIMGQAVFNVPLRGSTGLVFGMAAIFLTGALFFGIMLSITLKKQVLANQMAILGSYLPTMLLSGFAFAIENMPRWIQFITYAIPARYFIALLRGIYLKGIGLEILWLNATLLTIYALVMVIAANKRLKLKLD
jgi:ABC-2 type transport system permease protein